MVWGQALDGEALAAAVTARFPELASARIAVEPLSGTVAGNLGDALGHALFDIEVSGDTAEEIQAAILAQLAEQGFTGEAVIDVEQSDGVQTINVELNETVDEAR